MKQKFIPLLKMLNEVKFRLKRSWRQGHKTVKSTQKIPMKIKEKVE